MSDVRRIDCRGKGRSGETGEQTRERMAAWTIVVVLEVMRSSQILDKDIFHLTSVIRSTKVGHSVWNP